jgi:hypothetical protein
MKAARMTAKIVSIAALLLAALAAVHAEDRINIDLIPPEWDAALAGDQVMRRLVRVSAPQVKGAHDAEFVCVGKRAYIVEHDNDVQPGHGAGSQMYCVLSLARPPAATKCSGWQ